MSVSSSLDLPARCEVRPSQECFVTVSTPLAVDSDAGRVRPNAQAVMRTYPSVQMLHSHE